MNKVNNILSQDINLPTLKSKIFFQHTFLIPPKSSDSMLGAGYLHKDKRLITHTTLHHNHSALQTFVLWQILAMLVIAFSLATGLILYPLNVAIIIIGLLSIIYFVDALFNLYLILKSLYSPPEINFTVSQIKEINETDLPLFTILCPLYREARVLPAFLESMANIDWPKDKLEVLLLLEENDLETQQAALCLQIPSYVRTVIVPHSEPKTKPKACNYGLAFAHGEYLVIYDAEDKPDTDQLKKAYLGFKNAAPNIACLQAKLNYYNPNQNLLTRLFTAEYSLWFDIILTGLQTIDTAIPLGGTSNHFKTQILRKLQGWDPFNVTEDCDLGIRLFKEGYKTAIIDSTTLEEANSNTKNWLRQRSRWIKGYFQTFFIHNRNPLKLFREQGTHAFIFQLIIGARMSFMLINPILWLMTISYFALYKFVGPTIESFYPAPIFYMAVFSLVFGNFMYLYNYMIGAAKRGQWNLIKFVFLVPIYWLMASISATIAFYQLIFKPHYWEKTIHGLHLEKETTENLVEEIIPEILPFPERIKNRLRGLVGEKRLLVGGSILILSNFLSNIINFVFNTYLGRQLTFEDYGEISLFTSFLVIASIPLGALSVTVSHKVAYLFGKYTKEKAKGYLEQTLPFAILTSTVLSLFWLTLIPLMLNFFQYDSMLPFILFTPVWVIGLVSANFGGFLSGILSFGKMGIISVSEVLVKLAVAVLLIQFGLGYYIILTIPVSMLFSLLITGIVISGVKTESLELSEARFDKSFFTASTFLGLSTISFLAVDIILAKHFLSPLEAGEYGVLSLVGKIVFFGGSLLIPFIIPLVSHNEGAGKNSKKAFIFLFALTGFIVGSALVVLGIFGRFTVPLIFGAKSLSILPYLPIYLMAIGLFTLTRPLVSFYQAKKNYLFVLPGILLVFAEIILLYFFHSDLNQFVRMIFCSSSLYAVTILSVYLFRSSLAIAFSNLKDFYGLFTKLRIPKVNKERKGLRILIFNWRDTKHVWAGGAEVYVHELAKRWVEKGNQVAVFCGNDTKCLRNEKIDGVQIYRRGGFYMVYVWAFLYYMVKFRSKYDVIIDSENGIPFFTPLFAREKIFLLIHHVHQDVFLTELKFPLSEIGRLLEGRLMPFVYRNQKVITVSESSKRAIENLGLGIKSKISIINPGVDLLKFKTDLNKTPMPSLLYLGRLKPYKSLDKLIRVMTKVKKQVPSVTLTIAGEGESRGFLEELVQNLKLKKIVKFAGSVSEKTKVELLAKSWALVQPSRVEGWGITIIEANAAGTCVIASDVAGLRDSVKNPHTGLLVTWDNQEKWVDAICKVLKDEEFRGFLELNLNGWVKNFTWDKSSKKLIKLLRN
jgi:glycosyltransferase involved in cell wall biosynthesis/cellulose synthase/poly-beta-1,6-N-acetylglucosamine synthase-like glycosyltransferase/O-antigen/teichoic acid export membrane protein